MPGDLQLSIYWDTGIFLAYMTAEKRDNPDDMLGIKELVSHLDRGELQLVTSVITLTEILESQLPHGASTAFERLFERHNYHLVDVDARIARIASGIRDYYSRQAAKDGLPTVTTPDALHLATAVFMNCRIFHTFDAKDRPGKSRALLPLSGVIAGRYLLRIERPRPGQPP